MTEQLTVLAVVTSADRALRATIDISAWIVLRADADRSGLLTSWEHGFADLGDDLDWSDYDTPEIEAILEQILSHEDDGGTALDPSVTIDPHQILPFLRQANPRGYAWMQYQIEALGGEVGVLPVLGDRSKPADEADAPATDAGPR